MMLNIIFVIAGFMLLVKGADYLVDGSSSIARRFGISTLVIGLTVVAFGTSAPELTINILSAVSGRTELALANVNGSNIANILLILGITAFLTRIPVRSRTVLKEIPFMLLSGFVIVILMLDMVLEGAGSSEISRIDGIILLSFFAIFMYYLFLSIKETGAAKVEREKRSLSSSSMLTIAGLIGLIVGGYLAVEGASGIALGLGISETLVGLTIVAIGTSLPELVAAVVAARKNEIDLAVGGVVGSNIFNILLVLGATSVIQPITINQRGLEDAIAALAAMILLFFALFTDKSPAHFKTRSINGKTGAVFLFIYVAYIVYIVIRG
ncbi:calcium/sodium antiporter [Patescibacteria group bacterium]|nr:calcium/sodium antiporter [Patescibacteria group bacterium]